MKKEIADKWIAALESGEYKQTQGCLGCLGVSGNSNRFCCLGVLCELAVKEGVIPAPECRSGGNLVYQAESTYLPLSVQIWADLSNDNGVSDDRTIDLAKMNDKGTDFATIANIIRENVGNL